MTDLEHKIADVLSDTDIPVLKNYKDQAAAVLAIPEIASLLDRAETAEEALRIARRGWDVCLNGWKHEQERVARAQRLIDRWSGRGETVWQQFRRALTHDYDSTLYARALRRALGPEEES